MSAKPTELKKLMALLDTEADDITAFSKAVWNLVEDLLNERERYVVFAIHPSLKTAIAVGPYNTLNQLQKDYAKHVAQVDDSYGIIATVRDPSAQ